MISQKKSPQTEPEYSLGEEIANSVDARHRCGSERGRTDFIGCVVGYLR